MQEEGEGAPAKTCRLAQSQSQQEQTKAGPQENTEGSTGNEVGPQEKTEASTENQSGPHEKTTASTGNQSGPQQTMADPSNKSGAEDELKKQEAAIICSQAR